MKRGRRAGIVGLATCMVLSCSAVYAATGVVKFGLDMAGKQEMTRVNFPGSETFDVDPGLSLAVELEGHVSKTADFGFGVEFQSPRKLSDFEGDFQFIPIYGLIKLHPKLRGVTPYFIGQLGIALFGGDAQYTAPGGTTNGGVHVGIGGGLVMSKQFQVELLVTSDTGKITYPAPLNIFFDVDVVYTKTTLSFGLRF